MKLRLHNTLYIFARHSNLFRKRGLIQYSDLLVSPNICALHCTESIRLPSDFSAVSN